MLEEFLSELDTNQKMNIIKYASIFAGGMIVGYSVKKVLDSYDLDVIKNNAISMVDDYVNPKIKYLESFEKKVVDEENDEDE